MNHKHWMKAAFAVACYVAVANATAGDLLATVKNRKEIVIATEAAFMPFEFVSKGAITGYDEDLLHYVLEGLPGVRLTQRDLPWAGVLPGLAAGKFDMVVTAVGITPERDDKFAFTVPVADATVALVKRANDGGLAKAEDISGRVVGAQVGTSQLRALQHYDKTQRSHGHAAVKDIKEYATVDEAYADLAAGRIDAVAQSLANLSPLVKTRPDTFAIVKPSIGPQAYFAWVGRKDNDSASLVKFFSDRIAQANSNGKMRELQIKWFGFPMPVPVTHVAAPADQN
ncbi:transporter substrate-binding domain-containing protein [Paraburkholderia sp. IW21]|uniref:transporter substrate-binding domain-containing protein n=1 Tax=Paraburkholderia sp. IW21 TaxID=3242488 RepID=UPI003520159C